LTIQANNEPLQLPLRARTTDGDKQRRDRWRLRIPNQVPEEAIVSVFHRKLEIPLDASPKADHMLTGFRIDARHLMVLPIKADPPLLPTREIAKFDLRRMREKFVHQRGRHAGQTIGCLLRASKGALNLCASFVGRVNPRPSIRTIM
jgi:hypothetical protein